MQNVVIKINLPVKGLRGRFLSVSPPRFCLEWFDNFEGSESGQIRIVKLL